MLLRSCVPPLLVKPPTLLTGREHLPSCQSHLPASTDVRQSTADVMSAAVKLVESSPVQSIPAVTGVRAEYRMRWDATSGRLTASARQESTLVIEYSHTTQYPYSS